MGTVPSGPHDRIILTAKFVRIISLLLLGRHNHFIPNRLLVEQQSHPEIVPGGQVCQTEMQAGKELKRITR